MIEYINSDIKSIIGFNYVLNKLEPLSPYGLERKREMLPFFNEDDLKEELNKVNELKRNINENIDIFNQIKSLLSHIKDLRQSIKRAKDHQILSVVELYEVKNFISIIEDIDGLLYKLPFKVPEDMRIIPINELKKLFDPQDKGLKTFYIYDEYSQNLKKIRQRKRELGREIKSKKKDKRNKLIREIDVRINPKGETVVSKVDSDLIEILSNHKDFEYINESYMNIRYKIKDGKEVENLLDKLNELKELEEEEELNIREKITEEISDYSRDLMNNIKSIGLLDFRLSKAYLGYNMNSTKPRILNNSKRVEIVEGIHPEVYDELDRRRGKFVPISIELESGVTCITGANMGGKTVTLKLIALLSVMAQYGLLVPARYMEVSIFDYVYTSIGDLQSVDSGLSTFGGEIDKVKRALGESSRNGLIIIDELARGTNPKEGYAISKAIVKYLVDKSTISVITTHYDNVANTEGVAHYQVVGLENLDYEKLREEMDRFERYGIELIGCYMDYRLRKVEKNTKVPRDALNIARFMGLQEDILTVAENILIKGEVEG